MGPRQRRVEIAREAAGSRFADGGAERVTKVNLLGVYQSVVPPLLIPKEPRYLANTANQQIRPSVRIAQDWLNEQTVRMGLKRSGRAIITDAFYNTGIAKVALATPCDSVMQAWGITAGEPIVSAIDLDDFVFDIAAKDFPFATFVGHRYRCPVDVAKKLYGRRAAELSATEPMQFNENGDERIGRIFTGTFTPEDFEPHVELWEIYLPRHGLVVTLAGPEVRQSEKRDTTAKPLWVQKWVGPPEGPYRFLKFGTVPGSALAKAPMMDLYELHMDVNNVHRKANNMIRRLKEITIYQRNQEDDADAIKKAIDGQMVPVSDPDRIKTIVTSGSAIQGLFAAAEAYKTLFSFVGGNLELIAGRGAQSRTATQDKILNANAGSGISSLHDAVDTFMAEVGSALLWYAHNHPQLVMKSEYRVAGHKGVTRMLHPAGSRQSPRRDFNFNEFSIRVDPYSLRYKGPEERLAFVNQVLQTFAPMLQVFASQGITLDANALLSLFAEYGDAPELTDIFTIAQPPGEGGQAGGPSHDRQMPLQTERTYTRNSNPQPDQPGQAAAEMSKDDFGGTPQQQQGGAAA